MKKTLIVLRSHMYMAVNNCVGHDGTSYTVLKHVEVEF